MKEGKTGSGGFVALSGKKSKRPRDPKLEMACAVRGQLWAAGSLQSNDSEQRFPDYIAEKVSLSYQITGERWRPLRSISREVVSG